MLVKLALILGCILMVLSILMVGSCVFVGAAGVSAVVDDSRQADSPIRPPQHFTPPAVEADEPVIVTLDEYLKIRDKMADFQVKKIIGQYGEEVARSKMDGVPGAFDAVETVMYQWTNPDGSGMSATFQNNRLVSKAQFGLK